jgi:sugar lactone lactonase YvrE
VAPVAPPVEGRDWLTCEPIAWNELRGRVVIVVFWSYGCEASLLQIRQVSALVEAAPGPVTAIAVHTPRFPSEEQVGPLRSALSQHQIAIPVVHDPEFLTWARYNPGGWPATVVIDGQGRVMGVHTGTGDAELLIDSVTLALASVPGATTRSREVGRVPVSAPLPRPDGDLAFPTAVDVMIGGELIVADFANNRLLIFELTKDLRQATAAAEIDGLHHPHSVAADRSDGIYVSEPHLGSVSYLDLRQRTRQLLTSDLVVPTSLVVDADDSLVVTDSGAGKIYRLINGGPHNITMGLIAGSGRTGTSDGAAGEADLAQPTGLGRTEVGLVFCDSASSNVRLLTDNGKVATITGSGLFQWGLVDGPAHKALLQRPNDLVVLDDGSLIVVDTGNNRLRRLANRRIRTLGLSGLNRPAGACALPSGHLVVADTGNNRLVVVDPDLQTAWPLTLRGVLPPRDPGDLNQSGAVQTLETAG